MKFDKIRIENSFDTIEVSSLKKSKRILALVLVLCMMFLSFPAEAIGPYNFESENSDEENINDRPYFVDGNNMSGIFIETRNNIDYPSAEAGYWDLDDEARRISSEASRLRADTLFYRATPNMQAMYPSRYLPKSPYFCKDQKITLKNPLKVLIKQAHEKGLSVCSVISPFQLGSLDHLKNYRTLADSNPEWVIKENNQAYLNPHLPEVHKLIGNVARELILNYRTQGILLDFSDCMEQQGATLADLQKILESVNKRVRPQSRATKIGIILPGNLLETEPATEDFLLHLSQNRLVDFIIAQVPHEVSLDNKYGDVMMDWRVALEAYPHIELFSYQDASKIASPRTEPVFYSDPKEIAFRQFSDYMTGLTGSVINCLHDVILSPTLSGMLSSPQNISEWYSDPELDLPKGFSLGTPYERSIATDQDSYLITGMCDPSLPLLINREEYTGKYGEISSKGFFAVQVPLNFGVNHFVFEQNGECITQEIIRNTDSSLHINKPIQEIDSASVAPTSDHGLMETNKFRFSCIAPSGAEIIASFANGQYYPLEQTDTTVPTGLPVEYSASVQLEPPEEYQIKDLGHVFYSMTYQNRTTLQKSKGKLYQIGEYQTFAVQITDPLAFVYQTPAEKKISHTLPRGTKDYVIKSSQDHFFLESGGCIRKSAAKVLTNKTDIYTISKKIKNVVIQSTSQGEYITLAGGSSLPCVVNYDPEQRIVTLTLSHIQEIPEKLHYLKSDMFQNITVHHKEQATELQLQLKDDVPFYGYYVSSNEKNMIIYFRSRFVPDKNSQQQFPSNKANPLQGFNIVIDAAHGGNDIGDPSLLGISGPTEETINLALAQAIADNLHSEGANIFLTRSDHSSMAGIDRILYSQYKDADFMVSLHHCSGIGNKLYVTCNNEFSRDIAQIISDNLAAYLGKESNEVEISQSYLTGVQMLPAISIYIGDMLDPAEYEKLTSPVNIYRTSCKIAEEISSAIKKLIK